MHRVFHRKVQMAFAAGLSLAAVMNTNIVAIYNEKTGGSENHTDLLYKWSSQWDILHAWVDYSILSVGRRRRVDL
ncbi:hypothetical protein N7501_003061 [Penicillium viridicatum]|nr:hypothetical protein N7501_003061 [Penicillium viridicatum]